MEDDVYHPFQGLADILTVKERFGGFGGINFTMSWAYSPSVHKPRAVPQSAILYATMMGMNVTLAHPPGMELAEDILEQCNTYAEASGGSFKVSDDFKASVERAHVVYPKAWCPVTLFKPPVGTDDPQGAQKVFDRHKDWKCTGKIMELADKNAIYLHCLPADRGFEVDNDVLDKTEGTGWLSAAFLEAENRLHVQKAVMSLVMR
jgi:N-acetylornithine carbamoyltransferase